jgi:hypothetical protein
MESSNDVDLGELAGADSMEQISKLFNFVQSGDFKFICAVCGKPTLNC